MSTLRKHSVEIAGHRTSVSIEEPFWEALKRLADRQRISINALLTAIDAGQDGNLASAIRVHVLRALERETGGEK
jgi:predicted DNA-binding ribbon-helix-helix protein